MFDLSDAVIGVSCIIGAILLIQTGIEEPPHSAATFVSFERFPNRLRIRHTAGSQFLNDHAFGQANPVLRGTDACPGTEKCVDGG